MVEREMAELGAQPKRRKVERIEMDGSYLCFMTTEDMFVIKLSNLEKQEEVKDWTCLSPLKFYFNLKLPVEYLCPFEFDSKIYMAPGELRRWARGNGRSFPIYEFNFEEKEIKPTESLNQPSVPFKSSFVTNISGCGDVYFYVDTKFEGHQPTLMILYAATKNWEIFYPKLPFPPGESDPICCDMFALHDKIMLTSSFFTPQSYWTLFDPVTKSWTDKPDGDYNIFSLIRATWGDVYRTLLPQFAVSVPGLNNDYSVALSHTYAEPPEFPKGIKNDDLVCVRVTAFMVNQNGRVALFQYLDKCFEGIRPTLNASDTIKLRILDLGHGKLCALLFGYTMEQHIPVLCISIFTLSVLSDALQLPASPMQRDFLQVTVHSKSAYSSEEVVESLMHHAFVWPPIQGARFHRYDPEFCP
ncbi:hypothetical protein S83_003045 [Arachis hypogaea]